MLKAVKKKYNKVSKKDQNGANGEGGAANGKADEGRYLYRNVSKL